MLWKYDMEDLRSLRHGYFFLLARTLQKITFVRFIFLNLLLYTSTEENLNVSHCIDSPRAAKNAFGFEDKEH
jgi:hypothetical protein